MIALDVLLATGDARPVQMGQIYRFDSKSLPVLTDSIPDTEKANGRIHAVADRMDQGARDTGPDGESARILARPARKKSGIFATHCLPTLIRSSSYRQIMR
jgi:hypothetical protein